MDIKYILNIHQNEPLARPMNIWENVYTHIYIHRGIVQGMQYYAKWKKEEKVETK